MTGDLFPRAWNVRVDDLLVNALDIEFKILRSLKSTPNKCVLTIWNLNDEHRAQLQKRNRPNPSSKQLVGVQVQVEAGFVDQTPVLFSGDLREVTSARVGNDWKTTLSGDDGGRSFREARIMQTFAAGTTIGTVLTQACAAMGIGLGNAGTFSAAASIPGLGATLPHSMTLDGNAASQLKRVCDSAGLTFSIQNGVLQILARGQALQQTAILLSANTGLLDSPAASIDSTLSLPSPTAKTPKAPKPKDPSILKAKALLIPGLNPGRIVQLDSLAFKGNYTISEVEYTGETAGQPWEASMTLRSYN